MRLALPPIVLASVLAVCASHLLAAEPPAAELPSLKLIAIDGTTHTLTAQEWAELPRIELDAKNHDGQFALYSGVRLAAVLERAAWPAGQPLRGEWVRRYIAVAGRDGYIAVFAAGEADDTLTDNELLLADRCNGQPLDAAHGPFQLIAPRDKRQSRWVRQVQQLSIHEPQPRPAE